MTNSDLITRALRLLGVLNEIETASPEQGTSGLEVLNDLMADWEQDGIDLQYYPQDSLTDETPIPAHANAAVRYFLAFALAPEYGKQVSAEMATVGDKFYRRLVRDAVRDQVKEADMSNMPLGRAGTYDITRG